VPLGDGKAFPVIRKWDEEGIYDIRKWIHFYYSLGDVMAQDVCPTLIHQIEFFLRLKERKPGETGHQTGYSRGIYQCTQVCFQPALPVLSPT
jgi:hypothetical protein